MTKSTINLIINAKTTGNSQINNLKVDLNALRMASDNANASMAKWDTHKILTACSALSSSLNGLVSSLDWATEGYNSFDKAMRSANTMAGKDAAGFEKMKSQVSELGKSIPMTRDALANGLYQTIRSGAISRHNSRRLDHNEYNQGKNNDPGHDTQKSLIYYIW